MRGSASREAAARPIPDNAEPGQARVPEGGSTESGAPRPKPVMCLAYEELPPSEPPPLDDGEDGMEP